MRFIRPKAVLALALAVASGASLNAQYWQVDPTYAPVFHFSAGNTYVEWTAREADGRYLYAGFFDSVNGTALSNTGGLNLVRLNNDGSVDTAFPVQLTAGDAISEVYCQPDGHVLIKGTYRGATGNIRINTDGTVAPGFGPAAGSIEIFAVDDSGRIYTSDNYGPLTRYLADGTIDATFSCTIIPGIVAPLPNGKSVVVDQNTGAASRLLATGAVDMVYMTGGYVAHQICALPDGGLCSITNGDYASTILGVRHYTASNVNDLTLNVTYATTDELAGIVYDQLRAQGATFASFVTRYASVDVTSSGQAMFVGQGSAPQRYLKVSASPPSYVAVAAFFLGPQDFAESVGATASTFAFPVGREPFTFQWFKDGDPVPNATSNFLSIPNVQLSDAGTYTLLLTTPDGTALSSPAMLSVQGIPTITAQPQATVVEVGSPASLSVTAVATPAPTYQWLKDGNPVAGATSATLNIASAQTTDSGSYTVTLTNSYGSVTSSPAVLTVFLPGAEPAIAVQPLSQSVDAGSNASFTVVASGPAALSYQWYFDGHAIVGATSATYVQGGVFRGAAGSYTVSVTAGAVTVSSAPATLTVLSSQLINLSARAYVGTGSNILIAGYVVSGTGTKAALVRAVGPGLLPFGITGFLAAPVLSLFDGSGAMVATNTDWGSSPAHGPSPVVATLASATTGAFSAVGAFNLTAGSADSAMSVVLPAGLPFTAQVAGAGGTTGTALVELYDADTGPQTSRMVNLSSRAFVGTGTENLIVGFNISGPAPEKVLIRAVGPGLAQFGVGGILAVPQLTLYDGNGKVIATNTGWGNAPVAGSSTVQATIGTPTSATFSSVGAFGVTGGSADCALVATLLPGSSYTAEVTGVGSTTGVALAEIYEVP
jgi:Immunoglobulin domain/Domain of unknown function (DUF5122) beta-propeller